ncbi:cobalamin biosynthesis protein [Pseudonocardia endophytica]|uniref:Cobalamin biosynthesis protein CobD n=1 Tax=Pseudonocardia endophytica TaxID=401976 RepID=A0A4R1HWH5_PSEEN|nr:cobalamin biosynthesis protein [Pseudonocardia endophytica]TCK25110.1 adenosylcobinamide-phosphate synthase [Pseudonocardia endophytica]
MRVRARAAGLVIGVLADAAFGDPRRGHPVAAFGSISSTLERRLWRDSVPAGALFAGVLTGGAVGLGVLAERAVAAPSLRTRDHRAAGECLVVAAATWAVLGGTSLVREGEALGRSLESGDLGAARTRIPHLCARDPELLDAAGMARAGVESLAENTSDAVVAPLFWGAVAGVPGLLGYRAVNTLDAMVGYRSARYGRFGRVAARVDDVVNLVPARLTALLTVVVAPLVGGRPSDAVRAWRRDAPGHPSPNAGPVEATAAGALGLRLGGRTQYAYGAENRPTLGDGRAPAAADLRRAARLSRLLGWSATAIAAATAVALPLPVAPGPSSRDAPHG